MTERSMDVARSRAVGDRLRDAEQAVWAHYGLVPAERRLHLSSPAMGLRVREFGSGAPVLFVHGTVGPLAWAPLIAALPDLRSIVIDRPGWAPSDPVDFSAQGYRTVAAELLRGVLDELGIERTAVVGGSIGDVWALALADRYPERVHQVVLLGGGPVVADVPVPRFIRLLRSPLGAFVVRLPTRPARIRSILRQNGHDASLDDGRIPDVLIDWRTTIANETVTMRHERAMVRTVVGRSGWRPALTFDDHELARIERPTLIVFGSADVTGDVDLWRRVAGSMPRGALRVMDGAGHQPWFDDVHQVAALVRGWLAIDTS